MCKCCRGYWRINFEPLVYEKKLDNLGVCKEVVEKNMVSLRGWNYPHFPHRVGNDAGLEPGSNYYEGWISWFNHREFWSGGVGGEPAERIRAAVRAVKETIAVKTA